jgi:hypothetical protein
MSSVKIVLSLVLATHSFVFAADQQGQSGRKEREDLRTVLLMHRNWVELRDGLGTVKKLEQEIKRKEEQKKNRRRKRGLLKGEIAMALLSAL